MNKLEKAIVKERERENKIENVIVYAGANISYMSLVLLFAARLKVLVDLFAGEEECVGD